MEDVRLSLLQNIHQLQLPNSEKTVYKRYGKPPYSYAGMIIVAIMTSPDRMLSLSQIHEYLRNMFDFFQQPYLGWKDSVRHNLSHCKCFVKGGKTADGRNSLWTVNMAEVTPSLFRRQQTAIAKDGNYAEDLHDELQIPRLEIPFFNYSRGAPSKTTYASDRPSSAASATGSISADSTDTNDARTTVGNHGDHPSLASVTASSAPDCHDFNNSGYFPTPVPNRLPSGRSFNSPIVLGSPDKGRTTAVRPPSVLSTTSSSMSLRSLSEHPGQCVSPAFSDVTEPRTPDLVESELSGFRPINDDLQPGWITPLSMIRDNSDMTRGASCLSDVSPCQSECTSSSRRVPKRKQIRHRPKVRKAMRTDTPRTDTASTSDTRTDTSRTSAPRTDSTFVDVTYADLQTMVTQSTTQWEVSIGKAIGNLHGLCQAYPEAAPDVVVMDTAFNQPTLTFVPGIPTSEDRVQSYTGNDLQTTFVAGNGSTYIQIGQVRDVGELATLDQTYHIPGPHRNDHTYSSPERDSTVTPETKHKISDVTTTNTWGFCGESTTPVDDDTNSLEEFANCALLYGMLN